MKINFVAHITFYESYRWKFTGGLITIVPLHVCKTKSCVNVILLEAIWTFITHRSHQ